jgi:hypothetical protein
MPLVLTKKFEKSDKKDLAHFIIPRAEQKNNVAIDSVFIHETLDNFYEITVDLSAYGSSIKPAQIAIYNQSNLVAKRPLTLTPKKRASIYNSQTSLSRICFNNRQRPSL